MYDFLLTPEEQELKKEVRRFVRDEITGDFLRQMDNDEITYPREFVEKLAAKGLRGIRFPKQYGGRGMSWVADVAATEEIGCLGMALGCAFVMPSIVGEALNMFGTEEQKQKYLKPYIEGKLVAAEALTEPRGGSDFFGAMTRAERDGDHFILNGMKRFVVGAEGADFFLVYCKTNFEPNAHKYSRISLFIVEKGPGVETEYLYGLMGCRGGGTGRLVFRDVKVPKENLVGELHGGALCFHQMMIPERLTSAAGCLGVWGPWTWLCAIRIKGGPLARRSANTRGSASGSPTPSPSWMPPAASATWLRGLWMKTTPTSAASSAKPNGLPPRRPGMWSTAPCRSWGASATRMSIPLKGP
jgi:acyl-CoA dehydrogenase